jgi:hypothetical protein
VQRKSKRVSKVTNCQLFGAVAMIRHIKQHAALGHVVVSTGPTPELHTGGW